MKDKKNVPAVRTLLLVGVLMVAAIAGCVTADRYLPTADELIARGAASANADRSALQRGRTLAITECAQCHRFFWPDEYSSSEWREIVRRMAPLSSLGANQSADLELYFIASSLEREADTEQSRDELRDQDVKPHEAEE